MSGRRRTFPPEGPGLFDRPVVVASPPAAPPSPTSPTSTSTPVRRAELARPESSSQSENLARVSDAIGATILAFHRARLAAEEPEFTMKELQQHVASRHETAPDSTSRVMRDLRAKGDLRYELVSRAASLYRALPIEGAASDMPRAVVDPERDPGGRDRP